MIRIGVGGWTFEPWRGVFFPDGLRQKDELAYMSRRLTAIEVNGTYYGLQKPETFAKWAAETPEGFVFTVKGSRYATNRKVLAEAGESVSRFVDQGIVELGDKLGPLLWQFAPTKKFDAPISKGSSPACHGPWAAATCATASKCATRPSWTRLSPPCCASTRSPWSSPITPPIRRFPT